MPQLNQTRQRERTGSLHLLKQTKQNFILPVAVILSLFILAEVNYPLLKPQSALALFAMLGLIVIFLKYPLHPRFAENRICQIVDFVLVGSVIICFGYVVLQTEPIFKRFWLNDVFLGERASAEHILDFYIGGFGLLLILEATRRAIGLTLPLLAIIFLLYASFGYASFGQLLPSWLFPHLALFAMLGLIVIFLKYPLHPRFAENRICQIVDFVLVGSVIICFGYVVLQTEPIFKRFWLNDVFLGERASAEHILDFYIGGFGLLLILEATRRAIGLTLPLLAIIFLLYASFGYASFGQLLPSWLFPHRGYSIQRIISQTFLHGGVFGVALRVMFTYVFLFVLFGTFLEQTGATGYILNLARRIFGTSSGSPAKVAVIGSGMMGSLSGSAVANTATTGTFTIPLMRSVGFKPAIAGGIEAAASSGGALVPPIMGAAAYMMLEIVPCVTYLEIIRAALLPAILYYTALLLIVHFYAKRNINTTPNSIQTVAAEDHRDPEKHNVVDPTLFPSISDEENNVPENLPKEKLSKMQGVVFFAAFLTLIVFLLMGASPFRAVSWSLLVVLIVSIFHSKTRVGISGITKSMENAGHSGVSLIAAASCVGIILGVVTLTGVGSKLPRVLIPLAETNLILALFLLMISTIILGMGLPSSVCYLLMAILVGPVLLDLGVVPLAAHFFIFYFGMMSMVTPPVALAAYTAAAIADAGIMQTAFAAFRFALVGFALPYAFVLRPELLWISAEGGNPDLWVVLINLFWTLVGTVIFAASIAGYAFREVSLWERCVMFIAVAILFFAPTEMNLMWIHVLTLLASVLIFYYNWRKGEISHENYT